MFVGSNFTLTPHPSGLPPSSGDVIHPINYIILGNGKEGRKEGVVDWIGIVSVVFSAVDAGSSSHQIGSDQNNIRLLQTHASMS